MAKKIKKKDSIKKPAAEIKVNPNLAANSNVDQSKIKKSATEGVGSEREGG